MWSPTVGEGLPLPSVPSEYTSSDVARPQTMPGHTMGTPHFYAIKYTPYGIYDYVKDEATWGVWKHAPTLRSVFRLFLGTELVVLLNDDFGRHIRVCSKGLYQL